MKPGAYLEEDLDLMPLRETVKERLQDAIDSAAEQATNKGEEYIEYLTRKDVKIQLMLGENQEVEITYQLEEVKFRDTELVDASVRDRVQ